VRRTLRFVRMITGVAVASAALVGCGGSESSSTPTGPSTPGSPSAATITITANGVSPQQVRIPAGQRVTFVNNDSVPREPSSNPHPEHTDCPATNIGVLVPGASRNSGVYSVVRSCGFHDHISFEDTRFQGQILVGGAEAQRGPGY
jgi:plastocyanin